MSAIDAISRANVIVARHKADQETARIKSSELAPDDCEVRMPMPAEACTDIGYDDSAPEGFAIAALFALCCLLAVVSLSVVAYVAA